MKDISAKIDTMRTAVAEARVEASPEAVAAAREGRTPKGAVFDIARAAGIMAAKRTAELIPYCHPIPIDHAAIDLEAEGNQIRIRAAVKAVWRTGVEMEALTAASIAALTVYDMLKGIDRGVAIASVRLIEKRGGKNDFEETFAPSAAILVTSDSAARGTRQDESGRIVEERIKALGAKVQARRAVPDEAEPITRAIREWVAQGIQLIITTGGTGAGPRDRTADAVAALIERPLPGVAEAIRAFGQRRTPRAMLSRSVAGVIGKTAVVALPGSARGVSESLDAILPHLFHLFPMMEGEGH